MGDPMVKVTGKEYIDILEYQIKSLKRNIEGYNRYIEREGKTDKDELSFAQSGLLQELEHKLGLVEIYSDKEYFVEVGMLMSLIHADS